MYKTEVNKIIFLNQRKPEKHQVLEGKNNNKIPVKYKMKY